MLTSLCTTVHHFYFADPQIFSYTNGQFIPRHILFRFCSTECWVRFNALPNSSTPSVKWSEEEKGAKSEQVVLGEAKELGSKNDTQEDDEKSQSVSIAQPSLPSALKTSTRKSGSNDAAKAPSPLRNQAESSAGVTSPSSQSSTNVKSSPSGATLSSPSTTALTGTSSPSLQERIQSETKSGLVKPVKERLKTSKAMVAFSPPSLVRPGDSNNKKNRIDDEIDSFEENEGDDDDYLDSFFQAPSAEDLDMSHLSPFSLVWTLFSTWTDGPATISEEPWLLERQATVTNQLDEYTVLNDASLRLTFHQELSKFVARLNLSHTLPRMRVDHWVLVAHAFVISLMEQGRLPKNSLDGVDTSKFDGREVAILVGMLAAKN